MRIIFMGTPFFAVPTLKRLIESKHHQVVAVVTQPDKPAGRGKKLQPPPVKELALEHNIPVFQPEKLRGMNFHTVLVPFQPHAIVVVAYGKILPPEILQLPPYGCINLHASLLPKYRGAAPVQWAIINGERVTGVTIMLLDEGMDTGNIIATEEVEILEDDDTISLSNMLSVVGANLMLQVLDRIEETGKVESTPQDHTQATYAPMLKKSDGLLPWELRTDQILWRIRGLQPWPSAFSFLHGRMWKILKAEPFPEADSLFLRTRQAKEPDDKPLPGSVTSLVRGRGFTVATGDSHILVRMVQPQDKQPMEATAAVNGRLVQVGDVFVSDPAFLTGLGEDASHA
ncbi:MAG: methionyl-tRNA formyltransferase [Candidatus Sumerlaeaceae bacterium]